MPSRDLRPKVLCQTADDELSRSLQRALGGNYEVVTLRPGREGRADALREHRNAPAWALVMHAADTRAGDDILELCAAPSLLPCALPCFIASHPQEGELAGALASALNTPSIVGHLAVPFDPDQIAPLLGSPSAARVRASQILAHLPSSAAVRAAAAAYRNVLHLVASPIGALEMNTEIQRDQLRAAVSNAAPDAASLLACVEVQDDTIASVTRIGVLIEQLKDRMDGATDDRGPCDAAAVTRAVVATLGPRGIDVGLDLPFRLQAAIGSTALAVILGALLDNAFAGTPAAADRRVVVSGHPSPGNRVSLEIADNGPGVDGGDAAKLFEPFFTTRSGHAGLGLTVAHELACAAGGKLFLSPSAEAGARFTLQLRSV